MIYSIHNSDLNPDRPWVLPAPLTIGALYLSAGLPLEDEVATFLGDHGGDPTTERGRWYFEVWDRSGDNAVAAKASFIWLTGDVVCEAVTIEPDYAALPLRQYLNQLGIGLWSAANR